MSAAGRRCLIVDDEALVAMLLADYLEELDCTVVATSMSAHEALAAVRDEAFDLAILDCNLGGDERSWAVADALRERGTPFLFSSGLSGDQLPDRFADCAMLAKPYTLATLRAAMETIES